MCARRCFCRSLSGDRQSLTARKQQRKSRAVSHFFLIFSSLNRTCALTRGSCFISCSLQTRRGGGGARDDERGVHFPRSSMSRHGCIGRVWRGRSLFRIRTHCLSDRVEETGARLGHEPEHGGRLLLRHSALVDLQLQRECFQEPATTKLQPRSQVPSSVMGNTPASARLHGRSPVRPRAG